MRFDAGMFVVILVVAESVGFIIVQLAATPGGYFTFGKTIEPWRRRNFIVGTAGFMFAVALAAGLSEPVATAAAGVTGLCGLAFFLLMAFAPIAPPHDRSNRK